ncbi:MAG: ATP-dependent DNA helicase PcrA [Chlamydiia bacterium]|nr:ATP-dependent DNA helicase PcrA [Chlamydiia bacterium]
MQLNETQQIAVDHIEGPLLVLAGAGSGKTRIVTQRIVRLLDIGVPASEILALTFTNKAADEMRYRIKKNSNQNVLTCTFHALSAKILRESIHEIGFQNNFTIYDEEDSRNLIKSCFKILGQKDDKSSVRSVKQAISQAKNELQKPSDLKDPTFSSQEFTLLKEVYTLYQQKLKEYNALDFDDLLFLCVHLLRTSEKARDYYQKRWNFVLIDEYQDTNTAQYVLTRLLVDKHENLFVVGDPDQSIYSWRGANISNILNFEEDFPGAKVVKLEQNYRSSNHILSAANSLIKQNESRYEKNLWSALGDGEKVQINICENEHEEAQFVMNTIMDHEMKHISLDHMVIFYRTNSQSRVFEDFLLKERIPYVIIGGISFYQRREIKDMLALLRMAITDTDFISFARTINLPKRGLGPTTLGKLRDLAEKVSLPICQVCKKIIESKGSYEDLKISAKQLAGITEYFGVIQKIKADVQMERPLKEILKEAIESSKYLQHLKEDKETYDDRKSNLDELISKAAEWQVERDSSSLVLFLEELSLKSSTDDHHKMNECVKLMTLHNGKGLEFDITFIVGLEEDLLPHINSKDNAESLEEERRLCYVGMTRAKKNLYMTGSKYRLIWGTPRMMHPSRFLDEIDSNHINWPNQDYTFDDPNLEFSVGMLVFHKDFGKGVVKKSYSTSLGITYDVFFHDLHTTKSLVGKFAKLKLV